MSPCLDLIPQNSENCDGKWFLAGEKVNVGHSCFHMWQESHSRDLQQGGEPEMGMWSIWALWCWQPDQAVLPPHVGQWWDGAGRGVQEHPPPAGWRHGVRLQEGIVGQGTVPVYSLAGLELLASGRAQAVVPREV